MMPGQVRFCTRKDAPEAVLQAYPEAEWFIIEEPGGRTLGRDQQLQQMKQGLMAQHKLNFVQETDRVDGKIIHVGSKVPDLIAGLGPKGLIGEPSRVIAIQGKLGEDAE